MIFEKAIVNVYKSNICIRQDANPLLSYFSAEDFPGLQRTPFDFEGNAGQKLQGYYYYYSSPRKDRLIIFDHGMGNGTNECYYLDESNIPQLVGVGEKCEYNSWEKFFKTKEERKLAKVK